MSLVRANVSDGGPNPRFQMPGDLLAGSENILGGAIATVGNGTWTGSAIANGIINRTGPTGAYTDTTDTANNILNAITGNNSYAQVANGTTFRLRVINTVAQALTFAAGVGVVAGTGTLNIAASLWREYILTVLCPQPTIIQQSGTTNGSPTVTFVFSGTTTQLSTGPNQKVEPLYVGASVTGTGIPAGTTVIGLTAGTAGITGCTLSANATATNASVALTFGPVVQIDSIGSGTL